VEGRPITLDVSVAGFRVLLKFLFEDSLQSCPSTDWTQLLSIANALGFEEQKKRAIAEIDKADSPLRPVERVQLAKQFDVEDWLKRAYVELVERANALTVEEAEDLGIETVTKLCQARERLMVSRYEDGLHPFRPPTQVEISNAYTTRSGRSRRSTREDFVNSLSQRAVAIVEQVFWPKPAEEPEPVREIEDTWGSAGLSRARPRHDDWPDYTEYGPTDSWGVVRRQ